jgi:hypothetical protein
LVASEEEEGSPHRDLRSESMVRRRQGGWDERMNGMGFGKGRNETMQHVCVANIGARTRIVI